MPFAHQGRPASPVPDFSNHGIGSSTGARSLLDTLVLSGVDVCFANPGTSELHFVAALGEGVRMRSVLGLSEGVVTAAADGYFRIAGKPAATLLHLGPGLGNGIANLHNAKKARSAVVNIVGEHALEHLQHDAPLTADIEALAKPVSGWLRTSRDAGRLPQDAAAAVAASLDSGGQVATLIVPSDIAWGPGAAPVAMTPGRGPRPVDAARVTAAAKALRQGATATLLVGGRAVRGRALELAAQIAERTGCVLKAEWNVARAEGGCGRPHPTRIPYAIDAAIADLKETHLLVLAQARVPVSFFAAPGKPSLLVPPDCQTVSLADSTDDVEQALEALAQELGATTPWAGLRRSAPSVPTLRGAITPEGFAACLAQALPQDSIVADESISTGRGFQEWMRHAAPHEWMNIMGGAIGWGVPAAIGAAIAAPDRKVVALESDGSSMYILPALWTLARERLNVTVVLFANRDYRILHAELRRMQNAPALRSPLLSLEDPALDWAGLASGFGIPHSVVRVMEDLPKALRDAFDRNAPHLLEVVL